MSQGLQLLRSIIDNGARDAFRGLQTRYFTEDEQPAWRFVSTYFDRYGALPTPAICWENQIALPEANGPVQYFRDMLRDRTIYNLYQSEQQAMFDCINSGDMTGFVERLDAMVQNMRGIVTRRDTFTLAEALTLVMEDFEEARASLGMRGVTYGWPTLDNLTGGARAGDVTTIVARPGLGKSFSLLRMSLMAWSAGYSVGFVTMEMMCVEMARRALAMGSGVGADLIQRGHVSAWGEEQLRATMERMTDMPPYTMLVGDLSKSVRDVDVLIQEHEPDVVYVDAGYLLNPTKDKTLMKRFERAAETIRELKSLSTTRSKPLIQTVQFNRSQKADEEFSLDNIGGTDEVGQISSLVLGMRRGSAPHEHTRRSYQVIKNRHGPDGVSFTTNFLHTPFDMDEVEEETTGITDEGDWDGVQGPAPARTEWTV